MLMLARAELDEKQISYIIYECSVMFELMFASSKETEKAPDVS